MKAAFVLMCTVLVIGSLGLAQKSEPTGPSKWQTMIADDFKDGISIIVFNLDGKYVKPPAGGGSRTPRLSISCSRKKLGGANIELGTAIHYAKGPAGGDTHSLNSAPRIRFAMQWDDKKTPDEDWGKVMNDGEDIYLDQNQTLKLLTGYPGGPHGTPHGYVDRQSISVVDALGHRIVMQFDIPKESAGLEGDCGLEGWIKGH
jgi:hypothetical protein